MPKNIIICCDGTDNEIATDVTNVFRLAAMCERSQDQIVFYDTGIGTVADPNKNTWLLKKLNSKLDSATAMRISVNVLSAYRFLVNTFQPGDQIYMFGFSRGAYTVRAVAGMINHFGLFFPEQENLCQMAWAVYSNDAEANSLRDRFRAGNRSKKHGLSRENVKVHFMGCWDTVASYLRPLQFNPFGVFVHKTLMHTAHNMVIENVRHAIALDERRAFFKANYFRPSPKWKVDIKQVYFPGVHSDVGGGYPDSESNLSKIPLEWMVNEAIAKGLKIDMSKVSQFYDPMMRDDYLKSYRHESLQGLFHLIELAPSYTWRPTVGKKLPGDDGKRWKWPNFWRRRVIPNDPLMNLRVHQSVLDRINAVSDYRPVNFKEGQLPREPW